MSLNSAQYEAVVHKEGPCMVLAGPGSGKTLTIAKRIEYLIKKYKVRPEEILVITFTKYAAQQMKSRFQYIMKSEAYPVTFGTFHGIYYGILKWAYNIGPDSLLSEEEKYQLLRQEINQAQLDGALSQEEEKDYISNLISEIGYVKNNLTAIETYEAVHFDNADFRKLYDAYEAAKKKYNKIDFEDMLLYCLDLFQKRKDILEKWQQKFQYILVDEFQDINQVQYEVIRLLASPLDNLFIVGDDDQSVYGFRGAKPAIMLDFQKDYPKAKTILLNKNYRCPDHIVNGALRVIGHNEKRYKKSISPVRKSEETVHVQEVKNVMEESKYIAERVREYYSQGIPYEQMAVLYRTNTDARAVSEGLSSCQIPFYMKEYIDNIYDHFIGKDMDSYLRLSLGEKERSYFLQIANRPKRYIARESMSDKCVTYESLRNFYCDKDWMMDRIDQLEWDVKMLEGKAPYLAIQYIRKKIGYDEFLKEYADYHNVPVEELFDVLEEIQERSKEFQTVAEWIKHIADYREELKEQYKKRKNRNAGEKGITLMTMHSAKGLEYDTVFVIQGNEGVMPYKKAETPAAIEEERRLFYVAMTRAKRKLIISYVKEKNGKELNPSRFVGELLGL